MTSASTVSKTTLSVGPLLSPLGKPTAAAAAAVSVNAGDKEDGHACDGETVVVEGVSFAVVIVIAFAAFIIGVLLMSSLWFIYVKTSESALPLSVCLQL